jgi:glucose/arabinose dehydrogenase
MSGFISLETSEISVSESDGVVRIVIVREGDDSQDVVVNFETVPGSAGASDFTGITGTVTIPAGEDRAVIEIPLNDDSLSEATEDFSISLSNVSSGALQFPRTATVSILDDENPVTDPPQPPLESDFDVSTEAVFTGLDRPIAFEFSPADGSLMYVAEKNGRITLRDIDTGETLSTVLDLRPEVNDRQDRGLLDIAIHPDFQNNPFLYTFYTVDPPEAAGLSGNAGRDGGGNRFSWLVRWELDPATGYSSVVDGSKTILLGGAGQTYADVAGGGAVDSTNTNDIRSSERDPDTGEIIQDYLKVDSRSHAGGAIEFGPDGALYVSTGDGTSFGRVDPRTVDVQDINSLSGKILRIDPITGEGLADNPFFTGDAGENASKVYQLGLRNPFSMSFDAAGQLIITDTGWNNWEEINVGGPGANFGWPFYEGGDLGQNLPTSGYRNLPEAAAFYAAVDAGEIEITAAFRGFSHRSNDPGFQVQAITGADDVIRSDLYPLELQNHYIFTDVSQSEVYAVNVNDRRDVKFLYQSAGGTAPVHYKQGPDGRIYYADLATGEIGTLSITGGTSITRIDGMPGDDFLLGTAGDDLMLGNGGRDVFAVSLGDDTIIGDAESYDQVDYDGGRNDYIFTENPDGRITVEGAPTGTDTLTSIEGVWFRGAAEWVAISTLVAEDRDGPILGTGGSDRLSGTPGDDVMLGLGGVDVFVYSAGDDAIFGFDDNGSDDGAYDQVDYAGTRDDYVFTENPDGSIIVTGALTGTDTLTGVEGVWFFGAAEWVSIDSLVAEDRTGPITGTAGRDTLRGTDGADTMIGLGDFDKFLGSPGDDLIYGFDAAGGDDGAYDQVDYPGSPADYTFTRNPDGSVTVAGALTGNDTLTSIEGIWFDGSREWRSMDSLLADNGAQASAAVGGSGLLAGLARGAATSWNWAGDKLSSLLAGDREGPSAPQEPDGPGGLLARLSAEDRFDFSTPEPAAPADAPEASGSGLFAMIAGVAGAIWTKLTAPFRAPKAEIAPEAGDWGGIRSDSFDFTALDDAAPAIWEDTGLLVPVDAAAEPEPTTDIARVTLDDPLPPAPDWSDDMREDWMG